MLFFVAGASSNWSASEEVRSLCGGEILEMVTSLHDQQKKLPIQMKNVSSAKLLVVIITCGFGSQVRQTHIAAWRADAASNCSNKKK